MEGEYVPFKEAKVHFLTSSLHYGTSVFEGIRAYSTDAGPAIFRLKEHIERLFKSAQIIGMPQLPHSVEEICGVCAELVRMNNMEDCYIRPLVYVKEGGWNLCFENVKLGVTVAVWKWNNYLGENALKNGIRANISSFHRHHPNVMMTKGKTAGNYVNSVLAKSESVKLGFDEAIMLETNGTISECTGENIFAVRGGVIYTPARNSVLEGITRDTIITVAKDNGYKIVEEVITRDQLYIADEVFVTGTAAEVIALSEIDFRKIGTGKMGTVCGSLQKAYADVIRGRNPKYNHWLDYVRGNKESSVKAETIAV